MWRCGRIELYYEVIGREGWSVLTSAAKAFFNRGDRSGDWEDTGAGMRKSGEDIPNSRNSKFKGSESWLCLVRLNNTQMLVCFGGH